MSSVAIQAGRVALIEQSKSLDSRISFALETTLTGQRELKLMQKTRDIGYKVNLIYIGLDGIYISNARVESRATAGGHSIPVNDIIRRYPRSLASLTPALSIAHRAYILDNSGNRRRLIISTENNSTKFRTANSIPQWVLRAIPDSYL